MSSVVVCLLLGGKTKVEAGRAAESKKVNNRSVSICSINVIPEQSSIQPVRVNISNCHFKKSI